MKMKQAVIIALLYTFALTPVGAAEATLDHRLADIANPANYFHYDGRGEGFAFSKASPVDVQGVTVNVPMPDGVELSKKNVANINFFYFTMNGVSVLECSFRPEVEKARGDGEPLASKKLALVKIVEDNIAVRESAENINDRDKLAVIPVIGFAQSTATSAILEARNPGGEKRGTPSLFEGYVILGDLCVPVAANGHAAPSGIDTGELYMAWLNELLKISGE
jgi:hypothetical protein